MPSESSSTANYEAVIADLRAKREELDRTIATLELMAGTRRASPALPPTSQDATKMPPIQPRLRVSPPAAALPSGQGIGEAVAAILRRERAELTTRAVTDLLIQSGFKINTKNPFNNVWSALRHRAKVTKDIQQHEKVWRWIGDRTPEDIGEEELRAKQANGVGPPYLDAARPR